MIGWYRVICWYRYGDTPRWVAIRSPFGGVVYHVRIHGGAVVGSVRWEA